MANAVTICNIALSRIGNKANVSSIDPPDESTEAEACARFYPLALGTLLDEHNWSFATKRATLALRNVDATPWQYAYSLPSDCRHVIVVERTDEGATLPGTPWVKQPPVGYLNNRLDNHRTNEFEVMASDSGLILCTNVEKARVRYVMSQPSAASFPSAFTEALTWLLTTYLAGQTIRGEEGFNFAGACNKFYKEALDKAKKRDCTQAYTARRHMPNGVLVR